MSGLPSAAQGSRAQAAGKEPAACGNPHGNNSNRLDASHAEQLLASLGFLLVPGPPFDRGPAYLLVALRQSPTLSHYDPERIALWTPAKSGAAKVVLDWPLECSSSRYSWGTIDIIDRLGVPNRFASFGGVVSIARDRDLHALLLRSEAPILAAGGHSDRADPVGTSVAAFFGVLRASAGNDTRVNDLVRAASPDMLYATYLARTLAAHEGRNANDLTGTRLLSLLRQERGRLQLEATTDQRDGENLAALIAAIPSVAPKEMDHGRAS